MKVPKSLAKEFILGKEEAVSEVYYKYRGLLYFIISTYVKSKEDCEDVYQDVFLNVLNNKEDIKDSSNLHSYLCQTAKAVAINYAKKNSKCVLIENDEEIALEERSRIDELLPYNLTKDEKVMVGYKLCFGLSYKEIQEITGTPIPTLKLRYSQALKKIKEANHD